MKRNSLYMLTKIRQVINVDDGLSIMMPAQL